MHVYKIKTQSKEKLHGTTLRVSVNWVHWQHSWLLPLWREEVRSSTSAGFFSFLSLIFLCNGAGLKRRDTESEELLTCRHHGEERGKTTLRHVPLLPCLPLGPSQCVLRRCAPRLGYRARMSRLMDTKQRCPWWWRELGKLESIPAFLTHTPPTPLCRTTLSLNRFLSDCLCVCLFLSLRRGWSQRRCCTCCCCLHGLCLRPVWCKPRPLRPDGGWRCWRRSRSSGQRLGQWRWHEPGRTGTDKHVGEQAGWLATQQDEFSFW